MTLAAIISEYNPFHNGHQFHIEETRRLTNADGIVAIMSGNLVQRGDIAIFDKRVRSRAATLGGADLTIQLPSVYAAASAEFFALNAVKTLNALGNISFLSFGAETPHVHMLLKVAELLADEPAELSGKIKHYMSEGLAYPVARSRATGEILGEEYARILSTPNNILGIEYCKALILTNSKIAPCPILRRGAEHDSAKTSDSIASASYIRELLLNKKDIDTFVPPFAAELYKNAKTHSLKTIEKGILAQLIKMTASEFAKVPDVSEGLENRIHEAALNSATLEELLDKIKTKRYTHSRLRRIILSAYFGITDDMRLKEPQYISVLDHNEVGQKIIANAKKVAQLPIVRNTSQINKLKNPLAKEMWEQERLFDKIYDLTEE